MTLHDQNLHAKVHSRYYSRYQGKYFRKMRESDRIVIRLLHNLNRKRPNEHRSRKLLDIGCSTGNLLVHIKKALPGLELFGGDIVSKVIAENKRNPNLHGIRFEVLDALDLKIDHQFDFVTVNASLPFFDDDEFDRAIRNISRVVKNHGWLVIFDWFHPFDQEITIVERSKRIPKLKIHFRSYARVRQSFKKAGFTTPIFKPFQMPFDLPKRGPSDITSYTLRLRNGKRLCFRGILFQPWCHLIARKSAPKN